MTQEQHASKLAPRGHIIALAGKMGSGKDTVAAMLRMVGYQRIGFGDALRREVAMAGTRRDGYGYPPDRSDAICAGEIRAEEVYRKPTSDRMRLLFQFHGTDLRRAADENYWVSALHADLHAGRKYCITDLRFQNEVDYVRGRGGTVWALTGRCHKGAGANHVSEKLDIHADVVIDNSVPMFELAGQVIEALAR